MCKRVLVWVLKRSFNYVLVVIIRKCVFIRDVTSSSVIVILYMTISHLLEGLLYLVVNYQLLLIMCLRFMASYLWLTPFYSICITLTLPTLKSILWILLVWKYGRVSLLCCWSVFQRYASDRVVNVRLE